MNRIEPDALFALLGERWRIAECLSVQARSVKELQKLLGLGQSQVSHHLQKMSRAGIVYKQADGTYRLTNSMGFIHLKEAIEEMTK